MGILDQTQFIIPATNILVSGKTTDPDTKRKKNISRKDVREMAKKTANSTSNEFDSAQHYLNGYITLNGSEKRKELFDKVFKKEYKKLNAKKDVSQQAKAIAKVASGENLTTEEARDAAKYFRNRNLNGYIGTGAELNLGDTSLQDIAATSIGLPLGLANPATGALIEGAVQAGSEALPYVDKAIEPVRNWFLKDGLKWYDPRHVARVMFNPKTAYTAGGQAFATGVDLIGAGSSIQDLNNLYNNWKQQGYVDINSIPRAGMDLLGTMPIMSYADDFAKIPGAVISGIGRLANDTVDSYKALTSGVEPVLGIRSNAMIPPEYNLYDDFRSGRLDPTEYDLYDNFRAQEANARLQGQTQQLLPELPTEISLDVPENITTNASRINPYAPRPEQYSNLSPAVIEQLRNIGLGRYDVQNLLDRGFSTEQIYRLGSQTVTPGQRSNRRANTLAQRLLDMGESPVLPTRLDYLQSVIDNGGELLEYRNMPYTIEEWREIPGTLELDEFDHPWRGDMRWIRDVFYNSPSQGGANITPRATQQSSNVVSRLLSDREFEPLNVAMSTNIGVFGDNEWPTIQPQIQKIITDGISSGKSASEIEQELRTLYASYNKPFDFASQSFGRYGALAESYVPFQTSSILDGSTYHVGNPSIRATEYPDVTEIPYIMTRNDEIGSVSRFGVVDPELRVLAEMNSSIERGIHHGASTFEIDKSAQSSPMAHNRYAKLAKKGKGITTFLPSGWPHGPHLNSPSDFLPSVGYHYVTTNDLAGTRSNPRVDHIKPSPFGINNSTAEQLVSENIKGMENLLNSTQTKVFDGMGGLPRYGIDVGGTRFELPVVRQVMPDGSSQIVIQRSDALNNAISKYDSYVEGIVKYNELLDNYVTDLNELLLRKFPNKNYSAVIGSDGNVMVQLDDANLVGVTNLLGDDPEFKTLRSSYFNKVMNSADNPAIERLPGVVFHQPVGVFKYRKNGGKILNNLNRTTKSLLNI